MEARPWDVIGRNIKRIREIQGLSQTELSTRSGVNISSVFRLEKGRPIRITTVAKIAKGLDVVLDTVLSDLELPQERLEVIVHRAAKASWYAEEDRRSKIPDDHVESYQDSAERNRVGRLGFVSWFMAPPTAIMKEGPGVVPLEIHGPGSGAFNAHFYEDAVIYVIRGRVSVEASGETVDLGEGDWVGFKSAELASVAPLDLGAERQVPFVLWIGANRIKRRKGRRAS